MPGPNDNYRNLLLIRACCSDGGSDSSGALGFIGARVPGRVSAKDGNHTVPGHLFDFAFVGIPFWSPDDMFHDAFRRVCRAVGGAGLRREDRGQRADAAP